LGSELWRPRSPVLVAKLAADGTYLWSKRFGDAAAQESRSVAVDGDGNIIVVGDLLGSIFFGGPTLSAGTTADACVVKLSP